MSDIETEDWLSYKEMLRIHSKLFSLGFLDADFKTKMALISLICYITYKAKMKKPDVTHYQIVQKLANGKGLGVMDLSKPKNAEAFGALWAYLKQELDL